MYVECPDILYFDPQAEVPAAFCEKCGGECYRPSLVCLRCERREEPCLWEN